MRTDFKNRKHRGIGYCIEVTETPPKFSSDWIMEAVPGNVKALGGHVGFFDTMENAAFAADHAAREAIDDYLSANQAAPPKS
jgi:hypothetical protein